MTASSLVGSVARSAFWQRLLLAVALVAVGAVGCGKGSPSAEAPKTELIGAVTARADGFSARPGWAEPGQAWSKSGEVLIVVGYAKVRGDQRMEMAFRVSDSYARAELLRFLTVRVVAVLTDEESSGSSGLSEEDRRVLEERVTTQAEALIDDWFVSARYWERRKEGSGKSGGAESLHVFSRLEVDRAKVEELLRKSTGDAPDLRLSEKQLGERLTAVWSRMTEVTELNESSGATLEGVQAPEWARVGDSEAESGFSFVCQARADDERTAEALARARCNEKLCQLFGVQIIARTTVKENLDSLSAESEVTEQCADVRAVGRKTTNKSSECTGGGCVYWLKQSYSRAAYEAEVLRQKEPTIIRQEVVVQEGDVRYRDPAACDESLRKYAAVEHLTAKAYEARLSHLNAALKFCQGIDGRDSGLFASLNLLLTQSMSTFVFERGLGPDLRAGFAAVPVGFRDRLMTERFLTMRIKMVRDVVRDAVFPMQLIDATTSSTTTQDDAAFEVLVRQVIKLPFDDKPTSAWHFHSPHAIMLGLFYNHRRFSPTYRKFLLQELERPTISCDRPDAFDAEQVAGYLRSSDKSLDDQEYAALLTAFRRAPSVQMDRCLGHLVDPKKDPEAARAKRVKELTRLVIEGKLVLTEQPATGSKPTPGSNADLFESVVKNASREERFDLYLQYHARLVGTPGDIERLAQRTAAENFGGMKPNSFGNRNQRTSDEELRDCRSLAGRFRTAHERAPELGVTDTDVCECLSFPELEQSMRAELVQLWASQSDRTCKHFKDEEWPGGYKVWPYPKRRWESDAGTPFRRIPDVLRAEYKKCDHASQIGSLRFTPMLHATLEGRTLRKVTIATQIDGKLRSMTKSGDYGAIVTLSDVARAQQAFDACFLAAAEGYEVAADQLEKPSSGSRRVWIEFGDQGVSHGYD